MCIELERRVCQIKQRGRKSDGWEEAPSFEGENSRFACRSPRKYRPDDGSRRYPRRWSTTDKILAARPARSRHGPYTCSPGAGMAGGNYWLLNWGPGGAVTIAKRYAVTKFPMNARPRAETVDFHFVAVYFGDRSRGRHGRDTTGNWRECTQCNTAIISYERERGGGTNIHILNIEYTYIKCFTADILCLNII